MAEPARPFIGAVLTEIAKLDGGIPAAAAEMQISPQAINALANGGELSADELAAIHAWLRQRVALNAQTNADYQELLVTNSRRNRARVEPVPQADTPARSLAGLGTRQLVVVVAVVVVAIVITAVVTTTLARPGNKADSGSGSKPSADQSSEAAARSSSSATPTASLAATPAASPTPAAQGSSPQTPAVNAAGTFQTSNLSIAALIDGGSGGPYYKDLSVDPPVTTTNSSKGDVDVADIDNQGDVTLESSSGNGATIGMWTGHGALDYAQCQRTAEAAGVATIDIAPGQTVCVETSNGTVASLKLMSTDGYYSATFTATVWYPAAGAG